jgi:hypothetical protein
MEIPPSAIAPLGAYVYLPQRGEAVTLRIQGPVTREQQLEHDRALNGLISDLGQILADRCMAGKLGCLEHEIRPLDIVVDTLRIPGDGAQAFRPIARSRSS